MSAINPLVPREVRQITAARLEDLETCQKLAKMLLVEAGMAWLESRKPFLDPRTVRDYTIYLGTITKFFGNVKLEKLANPDLVRAYQQERIKTCRASTVNHETSILQQMLKRIRRWQEVSPFFQPLPLSHESPGRAMTPDEERKLFGVGPMVPGWATVYWLAKLSANTAAGHGELLGLRLRDVVVENPELAHIFIHEHVKNKGRVREVPLNADALVAANALLQIARERGAVEPAHYLVPYRVARGVYDPNRHGFWGYTAWREMCAAAGFKLRPYDLRHHGLTKLAEKNPEQVVIKIAGHVSPQMLRRIYAHVRQEALRDAVDSISSVNRAQPRKESKQKTEESREQTLFRVARTAEEMGIPPDKALQFLVEYERQQALSRTPTARTK
jgi:integrase